MKKSAWDNYLEAESKRQKRWWESLTPREREIAKEVVIPAAPCDAQITNTNLPVILAAFEERLLRKMGEAAKGRRR